jgi:hypothetical protein
MGIRRACSAPHLGLDRDGVEVVQLALVRKVRLLAAAPSGAIARVADGVEVAHARAKGRGGKRGDAVRTSQGGGRSDEGPPGPRPGSPPPAAPPKRPPAMKSAGVVRGYSQSQAVCEASKPQSGLGSLPHACHTGICAYPCKGPQDANSSHAAHKDEGSAAACPAQRTRQLSHHTQARRCHAVGSRRTTIARVVVPATNVTAQKAAPMA